MAKGMLSQSRIEQLRKKKKPASPPVLTVVRPRDGDGELPFPTAVETPEAAPLWDGKAKLPPPDTKKPKGKVKKKAAAPEKPASPPEAPVIQPVQPPPEPPAPPPEEYDNGRTFREGVSAAQSHRTRALNYYLANQLSGLDDQQILELLLQFAIPYRNTGPLAADLIRQFGGLPGVLGAGVGLLQRVEGMTVEAAALLDMVMRVARHAFDLQNAGGELLDTDQKVGQFLVKKFYGMTNEVLFLLCLDNACRLIGCHQMAEGSSSAARMDLRKICETALQCNAPVVILAHNHPSGRPFPSNEDIRATRQLQRLLQLMDIHLADHLIIAGDSWRSMARMGELSDARLTVV